MVVVGFAREIVGKEREVDLVGMLKWVSTAKCSMCLVFSWQCAIRASLHAVPRMWTACVGLRASCVVEIVREAAAVCVLAGV